MIKDVVDYCRSCEVCQKRPPITFRDRVSIEGSVVSVEQCENCEKNNWGLANIERGRGGGVWEGLSPAQ